MDNKDQDKGKGKGKYDPLTLAAAMHFTAAVLGVRAPEGSKVPSAVAKVMAACSVRPGGLLPAISAYIRSSYQQGQQLVEVDAAEGTGKHVFMDASVMHLEQAALAYEKTCGGLGAAFQAVPACVTQFQSHFHEEKGKEKEGTLVGEAQLGKREQELGCLRLYVSLLCRGLVAPTAPTSTQREGEGEGESCQSLYTRLSAVVGKPMSAPDVARELGVVSSGLLTWQRGRLGQVGLLLRMWLCCWLHVYTRTSTGGEGEDTKEEDQEGERMLVRAAEACAGRLGQGMLSPVQALLGFVVDSVVSRTRVDVSEGGQEQDKRPRPSPAFGLFLQDLRRTRVRLSVLKACMGESQQEQEQAEKASDNNTPQVGGEALAASVALSHTFLQGADLCVRNATNPRLWERHSPAAWTLEPARKQLPLSSLWVTDCLFSLKGEQFSDWLVALPSMVASVKQEKQVKQDTGSSESDSSVSVIDVEIETLYRLLRMGNPELAGKWLLGSEADKRKGAASPSESSIAAYCRLVSASASRCGWDDKAAERLAAAAAQEEGWGTGAQRTKVVTHKRLGYLHRKTVGKKLTLQTKSASRDQGMAMLCGKLLEAAQSQALHSDLHGCTLAVLLAPRLVGTRAAERSWRELGGLGMVHLASLSVRDIDTSSTESAVWSRLAPLYLQQAGSAGSKRAPRLVRSVCEALSSLRGGGKLGCSQREMPIYLLGVQMVVDFLCDLSDQSVISQGQAGKAGVGVIDGVVLGGERLALFRELCGKVGAEDEVVRCSDELFTDILVGMRTCARRVRDMVALLESQVRSADTANTGAGIVEATETVGAEILEVLRRKFGSMRTEGDVRSALEDGFVTIEGGASVWDLVASSQRSLVLPSEDSHDDSITNEGDVGTTDSTTTTATSAASGTCESDRSYEIKFEPGPMGLVLGPVLVDGEVQLGCKVTDLKLSRHVSKEMRESEFMTYLEKTVVRGDIISHIDGKSVTSLSFAETLSILRDLTMETRMITFKDISSSPFLRS